MSTLPESGAISLGQLQTEFGGTNPVGMSEYYRGGSEVPDTGATLNIPTAGNAISLGQFYGTQDVQYRNVAFQMRYDIGPSSSGTYGLSTQSSTATPSSFSNSSRVRYYQPVFRAGTNFITSLNFTIQQNEDCSQNDGHVIMYGGTTSSNVTDIVYSWTGYANGSQGGSRSYRIDWNANGSISSITYTGGVYNTSIVALVTTSVNSDHRWYGFSAIRPSSVGKASQIIDLSGLTNTLQPD